MKQNKRYMPALLLLALLMMTGCAKNTESEPASRVGEAGSDLTINASTLTQEPAFVDWVQDGTAMQLIARKDETGAVRLAFNTCQSCGGSPYAWFEDLGDGNLQCQNCGLTFPLDTEAPKRPRAATP